MHKINDENINRVDEIYQEVGSWKITNSGRSYVVIVLKYFRLGGVVEYGGYFKSTTSDQVGDATGDFYQTPDEALNNLVFRVALFISSSD